jgi:hypothetical protein
MSIWQEKEKRRKPLNHPYSEPRSTPINPRTHPLQDRDGESGGLSSTRLGLSNDIPSSDDRHDSPLLDSRRTLETVSVDTTEEFGLELHVVEAGDVRG